MSEITGLRDLVTYLDTHPLLLYTMACGMVISLCLCYAHLGKKPLEEFEGKTSLPKLAKRKTTMRKFATFTTIGSLVLLAISRFGIKKSTIHLTGDEIISLDTIEYLERMRTDWGIPGVSIAVVNQNQRGEWQKQTLGFGGNQRRRVSVTDETLFSIASNSKLFTALSAGLALSRSNLTWDTRVIDVFPAYSPIDKETEEGTRFIELLSHQTGLPRHDLSYNADATPEEVLSSVKYLKPSAAFKSHWQYNNIAFTIASHVPYQLLDGISFDAFVQEEIWNPLGMKHTFYDIELARKTNHMLSGVGRSLPSDRAGFRDVDACWKDIKRDGRLSTQCRGDAQDLGWFQKDWTGVAGAGGVITCSKDMAVWLQTLLSNGTCPGTDTPVIPSWMIRDAVLPQIAAELKPADPELSLREYGLAQASFTYRGYQVVEHGGDVPGQKSQVIRLPGEMIGIAIMVNDEQLGGTFHEVAKWRIIDELLGLKPIDWESRLLARLLTESKPKDRVALPSAPSPPVDGFPSIAGTYSHPAYGTIVLRPLGSSIGRPDQNLIDNTRHIDSFSVPSFVADINKVWAKEFVFTHFDGDIFNLTSKHILPETGAVLWDVNGAGTQARFGEGGVGITGIWGAGEGVPDGDMDKHGIKNGSEVFFTKV